MNLIHFLIVLLQLIMEIEQLKEELNNLENDYINKNNKLKE